MDEVDHISDADLVKRSLENPDNFSHIIRRYSAPLGRYIRRRSHASTHDMEDMLQDIFIKVYKNLNDFDQRLSFSSWIYRITHNHIIDWYRKEKRHDTISLDDEDSGIIYSIAGGEEADKFANFKELSNEVSEVLGLLPPGYKDVIVLRFFEDKSYEEISDIMRIPISAVGVRINRAKSAIKKKLLEKRAHSA